MTLNELIMLSALGIPAGALLLALFSGPERIGMRKTVARWCLVFGAISTALAVLAVAIQVDLVPAKGVLGMAFFGLPALPAGLLLHFFSRDVQTHEKASHDGNA